MCAYDVIDGDRAGLTQPSISPNTRLIVGEDRRGSVPSRRQLLSTSLSLAAGASLAGCLTDVGLANTGFLQLKAVDVEWHHQGRRWQDEVLWAVSDGDSELRCRVAESYRRIVEDLDDVRVDDRLEERILEDFSAVTYALGFCWEGPDGLRCRNLQATREAFNRVQFGDRAEVVVESPRVEVVDVYEDAQGDPDGWETEFRTFDFGAMHAENGVPIERGPGGGIT